ncbi:MAG: pyridoxal-phosphate dependent enzyme [Mesotoga sp.]
MGVSKTKKIGSEEVIIASDGNAGPATAAYCGKAGLDCFVMMPADTLVEGNVQTILYGAELILVEKSTVSDCIDMIMDLSESSSWTHLTTASSVNPYHFEGTKTIAFEIAEDLGWNTPDWVIVAVRGADYSCYLEGLFGDNGAGIITDLPRSLAVQAEGCAPLVKAFKEHNPKIERWEKPSTLA